MVKMQATWFSAIRKVCDSERGTILCEVAATGAKAIIRYHEGRLELVRVSDGVCVALSAEKLTGLRVSEAMADDLARRTAEIEAEQATATRRRLLDTERAAALNLGRWADGTYRSHGAIGR